MQTIAGVAKEWVGSRYIASFKYVLLGGEVDRCEVIEIHDSRWLRGSNSYTQSHTHLLHVQRVLHREQVVK